MARSATNPTNNPKLNPSPTQSTPPALPRVYPSTLEVELGTKLNHWTVTSGPFRTANRIKQWGVTCTCGKEAVRNQYDLLTGRSAHCGCLKAVSDETKQLLSARRATQAPPRPRGSVTSEETKAKMSASHRARHSNKNNP